MNTKYYEFQEEKVRSFFYSLVSIFLTFIFLYLLQIEQLRQEGKLYFFILMIFFASRSVVSFFKILYDRPYIRITPDYIKIGKFDRLLWQDIICVKKTLFLWSFDIRDISGYRLTILQEIIHAIGFAPFYIDTASLSKKNLKTLKRLLKERVSCEFD